MYLFNPEIIKAFRLLLAGTITTLSAASCTSQQAYTTGQAWQRNQCYRIMDQSEQERCLNSTTMSYEDYKRQTEGGKKQ